MTELAVAGTVVSAAADTVAGFFDHLFGRKHERQMEELRVQKEILQFKNLELELKKYALDTDLELELKKYALDTVRFVVVVIAITVIVAVAQLSKKMSFGVAVAVIVLGYIYMYG